MAAVVAMSTFAKRTGAFGAAVMRAVQGQVVSAFNDHPEWTLPKVENAISGISKRVASRIVVSWDRLSEVRAAEVAPASESEGAPATYAVRAPRVTKRSPANSSSAGAVPVSQSSASKSRWPNARRKRARQAAPEVVLGILAGNIRKALKGDLTPEKREALEARLRGVEDGLRALAVRRGGSRLAEIAAFHEDVIRDA